MLDTKNVRPSAGAHRTSIRNIFFLAGLIISLSGCGGSSGGGNSAGCSGSACSPNTGGNGSSSISPPALLPEGNVNIPPSYTIARQCAAPRSSSLINPSTGMAYEDFPGSLETEKKWIRSFVYESYLWYQEMPAVDPAPYVIGATVPYASTTTNVLHPETLNTNYDVVDAYFNALRTSATTASGHPKDKFHFTYKTSDWVALSTSGTTTGYGMQIALLSSAPPRNAIVALVDPNTSASLNNIKRGTQIIAVNGVDVQNGSDTATINEGLFSPVAGKSYSFTVQDADSTLSRNVTLTASAVTLQPVQNVHTLPQPYSDVGYILFNDHIATAEGQLVAAVNQLKTANGGAGIKDLILDIRYNGGGTLNIASELAYMIGGGPNSNGKTFEQEIFNDKNPFGISPTNAITPFISKGMGYSFPKGQALPQLNLPRVFVLTGGNTCSASESIMNGLQGIGVQVIQIGNTTCGKPYGFFPFENCSTTYFTINLKGVNQLGFGDYADGFTPVPGIVSSGGISNKLPGCQVDDDFSSELGEVYEGRVNAALQYRAQGFCSAPSVSSKRLLAPGQAPHDALLIRSPVRENRIYSKP